MASSSCQVDFYVVEDERKSVEQLACQLAMMAWEQGMRSMLLLSNQKQAEQLDSLMWSVPNERFLPHQLCCQTGQAPVTIGTAADLDHSVADVIINLSTELVPTPQRFRRLLELVPARDAERKASRVKFSAYRELGLQPKSHAMGRHTGNN
ncbi:MAG: DNA polymerase III subunit chi [Xanthomonadales bacterium]|nr:DNA polymerase III subunit chi [Xanthomonadales bacterium]